MELWRAAREETNDSDKPVASNPFGTLSASQHGLPSRRVHDKLGAEAFASALTSELYVPSARAIFCTGHQLRAAIEFRPRVLDIPGQHRIEASAINVPSRAVRIEYEIVGVQLGSAPRGVNPERVRVISCDELIPYSETDKKLPN